MTITKTNVIAEIASLLKDKTNETYATGTDISGWVNEGIQYLASQLPPEMLDDLQASATGTGDANGNIPLPADYFQLAALYTVTGTSTNFVIPVSVMQIGETFENSAISTDSKSRKFYKWGTTLYMRPVLASAIPYTLLYIKEPDTTATTAPLPDFVNGILVAYGVYKGMLNDGEFEKAQAQKNVIDEFVTIENIKAGRIKQPVKGERT